MKKDHSDRVGTVSIATNGQKMKIIAYRGYSDIDIRFQDETIVKHKSYRDFKMGNIRNPNITSWKVAQKHVGETNIANNGQKMTIIACRTCSDIDVQFEDKTIVRHKNYQNFKKGKISNPKVSPKNNCIGKCNIANNGQKMIIVAYRNANDIDVRFEDNTVVTGKRMGNFKKGCIENPNFNKVDQRLGTTKKAKNGQTMKVVQYRTSSDMDIEFEDGTVVRHRAWREFTKGYIKNPNYNNLTEHQMKREGTTTISSKGEKMKIVKYRSSDDIDVQFSDGTIVNHKTYNNFQKGNILNPNEKNNIIGMVAISHNGLKMKIMAVNSANDITVQFEDGEIVKHVKRCDFKKGKVAYPNSGNSLLRNFHGYRINSKRFTMPDGVYFSTIDEDGKVSILTPQMMMKKAGVTPVF